MIAVPVGLAAARLLARAATAIAPRHRLTVSQWADSHRWVSNKQSGIPGQWRTDRNPILREIMDCFSRSSPVREVWVMKSSQVGITEGQVNVIGYHMDHEPCPMMVILPTIENRDSWKAQKLNPLLLETPVIRTLLGGLKMRDATNSREMIDFPGGILFLSGGNSPNSYAQKSARIVLIDDFDRFPAEIGDEGGPEGLARGRSKAFPYSHKLGFFSTPTLRGASHIETGFLRSDRRRYHVHCPACGHAQPLVWGNLRWDQSRGHHPAWASYECAECGHGIAQRLKTSLLAGGLWVPEAPEIQHVRGYHVTALLAAEGLGPSWVDLARGFLAAKGDPATLKTFVNTNLGETWEDRAGKLDTNQLVRRMEDYPWRTLPEGCVAVTAGIDTQDDWLAVTLLGWGPPGAPDTPPRLWVLDYTEIRIPGKTTAQPEPWDELETYLNLPLPHPSGAQIAIAAAGIDSRGHRAQEVRAFVARPGLRLPVYSLQGSTSRLGRPIAQTPSDPDRSRRGRITRHAYGLWNVGTELCKHWIYGRLAADSDLPPDQRVIHFPSGLPIDFFDGLLSEVFDPEKNRFIQKLGARYKRNEPLDTFVYAWAIAHHKHVLIGMRHTRTGFAPDPGYWIRAEQKIRTLSAAATESGAPPVPSPAPAASEQRPKPARNAPLARDNWSKRL